VFRFRPESRADKSGTWVDVTVRLPLPRLLGWLRPLLEAQVRREVAEGVAEDRHDLEQRGYPAPRGIDAAALPA